MSQPREYRRRFKNNFLHSNHVRRRENKVCLGIKSVRNGGTAESSTEIKMLEKAMTGMPVWQAAIPIHGVPLKSVRGPGRAGVQRDLVRLRARARTSLESDLGIRLSR